MPRLYTMNWVNWVYIVLSTASAVAIYFALRKKSTDSQYKWMFWMAVALDVIMFVHKIILTNLITHKWLTYIPLELCNICQLILPFALYFRNEKLMSILFFIGVPCGIAAMLSPAPSLLGQNFYQINVFCYFLTHMLQITLSLLPVIYQKFRLKWMYGLYAGIFLIAVGVAMHLINVILRTTGVAPNANYLATFGEPRNPGITFFFNLLPIPFVWELPIAAVFIGVFFLEIYLFKLYYKKKDRVNHSETTTV